MNSSSNVLREIDSSTFVFVQMLKHFLRMLLCLLLAQIESVLNALHQLVHLYFPILIFIQIVEL